MSPILFGCFFSGDFLGGKQAFLRLYSLSINFFHFKNVLPVTCFCCFLGGEIICCGSAR